MQENHSTKLNAVLVKQHYTEAKEKSLGENTERRNLSTRCIANKFGNTLTDLLAFLNST